jgi:hypothetical protein
MWSFVPFQASNRRIFALVTVFLLFTLLLN